MEKNIIKVRAHDGIVGFTYLLSIIGATYINENLIYIAIGVGILQIMSPVTKFCPVYFCLLYTSPSPRDGLLSRMSSSA